MSGTAEPSEIQWLACCGVRIAKVDGEWLAIDDCSPTCPTRRPSKCWRYVSPCTGETYDVTIGADEDPAKVAFPCGAYHLDGELDLPYVCALPCTPLHEVVPLHEEVH